MRPAGVVDPAHAPDPNRSQVPIADISRLQCQLTGAASSAAADVHPGQVRFSDQRAAAGAAPPGRWFGSSGDGINHGMAQQPVFPRARRSAPAINPAARASCRSAPRQPASRRAAPNVSDARPSDDRSGRPLARRSSSGLSPRKIGASSWRASMSRWVSWTSRTPSLLMAAPRRQPCRPARPQSEGYGTVLLLQGDGPRSVLGGSGE
jgi:hypothetical protein